MTTLHVLRVFIGPDGRGGNPLGVFLDGAASRRSGGRRSRRDSASPRPSSSTIAGDGRDPDLHAGRGARRSPAIRPSGRPGSSARPVAGRHASTGRRGWRAGTTSNTQPNQ